MCDRFYYEQDGGGVKPSAANSHYVVDRYADPLGDRRRTDVPNGCGSSMAREARALAVEWNINPPWEPWDTIQAASDMERKRTDV